MAMIGPVIPLYLSAAGGGGTVSFSGTASGSASASANLTQTIALAGQSDGVAGASGGLDVVVSFGGTAAGGSSASGDLTIVGTIRFSGTAAGSATASADLTQILAFAGQADGSATATLAWAAASQPGGFVPDWAVQKFWKRVREEAKATVAKPKRPKRQGARIRYAEQVTEKAREIAEEIEAEAGGAGIDLSPLPEILYDVLLRDIGAIEMQMTRIEARMIAEEAERRLRQDEEDVLALLLAEAI